MTDAEKVKAAWRARTEPGRRIRTFEAMARVAMDQVLAIDCALQRLPREDERDFKRMPTYAKNAIRDARTAVEIVRKMDAPAAIDAQLSALAPKAGGAER